MRIDEAVWDELVPLLPTAEERSNVNRLRGVLHYKKGKYQAAIEAFLSLEEDLDETSAIYLSSAYTQSGRAHKGLAVLQAAAHRLQSVNLYHHLAWAYLSSGHVNEGLEIY